MKIKETIAKSTQKWETGGVFGMVSVRQEDEKGFFRTGLSCIYGEDDQAYEKAISDARSDAQSSPWIKQG